VRRGVRAYSRIPAIDLCQLWNRLVEARERERVLFTEESEREYTGIDTSFE